MAALMAKHKRYPTYQASGVEWLGDVPAHWEVQRIKWIVDLNPSKTEERAYLAADTPVTFLPMEKVGTEGQIDTSEMVGASQVWNGYTFFRRGDILVAKITPCFENGKGAHLNSLPTEVGFGSTEFHVLRAKPSIHPQFLYLLTTDIAFRQCGTESMTGAAGQQRVSADFVANYQMPLPPLAEQRAIATFLDSETAKIDALVSKKERLIELLQEKRTALISHTVTKGLDPNVPIKDSGVEWLGEIPMHWEVRRLKHLTEKIGGGKTPKGGAERYVEDGVMFLRSQNVHFGRLQLADVAHIDTITHNEMSGSRVREGDVLLNITGASLGRSCVARLEGADANVNQHVCILRTVQRLNDPDFLAYSIESTSLQDQIFNNENGVSRDALNFEQIGELVLSRPAIVEQKSIAAFLDRETAELDNLIDKVHRAIELLQELRATLISAAVTGKIDVREEMECT